jgi:TetR/AcrR family transcriptional regulator
MKRPRKLAGDPHRRIVAAAGQIFAASGFEGARIDEIAERAGVNKAMLYYHVGDKDRLYAAVLLESIGRALSLLQSAARTGELPSERLQAILDTFAAFGTSNPWFIPIILREVAAGGRNLPDEMFARMGEVLHVVAAVLAEGVERGTFRPTDPLLTHVSLVGALMYLLATHPIRQRVARSSGLPVADHTPEHLARHVGNLFLHGLEAAAVAGPAPRKRAGRKRAGGAR